LTCASPFIVCIIFAVDFGESFNFALMPGLSESKFHQVLDGKGLGEENRELANKLFDAYQMNLLTKVFLKCKLTTV
jgi:hypothetical protein